MTWVNALILTEVGVSKRRQKQINLGECQNKNQLSEKKAVYIEQIIMNQSDVFITNNST